MALDDSAADGPTMDVAPPSPPASTLPRGTCVGRYLILDPLGKGGMGVVYKAIDPQLNRPVALKLLRADEGPTGVLRDRLLREAQALARLQHPNVVAVYDVGTYCGDVFIAMEFVEGRTLKAWLNDERRSQRAIVEVFVAAGEGVAAAHRAGLVHRDFKPDNVIVADDGRVKVLDFGLARTALGGETAVDAAPRSTDPADPSQRRAAEDETTANARPRAAAAEAPRPAVPVLSFDSGSHSSSTPNLLASQLTHAGAILGTPRFMAPEQHQGEPVDERADQFSFCVSLYWALYQAFPFDDLTSELTLKRVLDGKGADPPAGSTVPRWLRQVLLRGLQRQPRDRFPSMTALLEALRNDPRAMRARWVRAAGVVALVGGIGLTWRAAHEREARVCAGAESKLAGIWDAPRRAAVEKAFRSTGLPYAEQMLATVERGLDGYARAFAAMHADACEATHVRKEQSQELLDLRMTCLSDRLLRLKSLTDLYTTADAKLVERAAQSIESLPSLDRCADAAALRAPVPPPTDPQMRARVDDVRKQLARADALGQAGRFDESMPLAKAAVAAAVETRYRPGEAEAQLVLGDQLGEHGDFAASSRAYYQALVAAVAGRDDETAASAAIHLINSTGAHEAHYEEADRWVELAQATLDRLQRKDDLLATFYRFRSDLRSYEDKLDDALADAKQALALDERRWGKDDRRVARTLGVLGQVYYARAEFTPALECYQRKRAIEEKLLGPTHPDLSQTWLGLGNVIGDIGRHEEAVADYRRALEIVERVNPNHPRIAVLYNNIGQDLEGQGKKKEAFEQYKKSLEFGLRTQGPSQITILAQYNMASLELEMNQPEQALKDLDEALESTKKKFGLEHHLTAKIYSAIGDVHRAQKRYDQAFADYQRALPIAEKTMSAMDPNMAAIWTNLGAVELDRHQPKLAVAHLEKSLKIHEAMPNDGAPVTRLLLARALWDAGDDRARAVALAEQAKKVDLADGDKAKEHLAEVEAWLSSHH